MLYRKILLSFLVIVLFFFSVIVFNCDTNDSAISDPIESEQIEEIIEEEEQITLSEKDFTFEIGALPYRGAVLFIDYDGGIDLSDYNLLVDVISGGEIKQENMPVEKVDGNLTATVVDLMYLPGDELDFVIRIQDSSGDEIECRYSETLERYPWKDWMLKEEETVSLKIPGTNYNFKYYWPGILTGLEAHSSWDYMTTPYKAVEVYCGTVGIVYRIPPSCIDGNLEIYNPYVGAIVQYGHTKAISNLYMGRTVEPGELIAHIIPEDYHIHYSVIRPYRYVQDMNSIRLPLNVSDRWDAYYFPIIFEPGRFIYHDNYNDPFYWHEPTTLGYWYEETLPKGLKDEMLRIFKRDNPDVILPATEPLEPLD